MRRSVDFTLTSFEKCILGKRSPRPSVSPQSSTGVESMLSRNRGALQGQDGAGRRETVVLGFRTCALRPHFQTQMVLERILIC
jgi:hypothetical protein